MTEGSGLYLAGPALVKAAIGQVVDPEELGGAKMHFEISGTVDFLEPNDKACLQRMRHSDRSAANRNSSSQSASQERNARLKISMTLSAPMAENLMMCMICLLALSTEILWKNLRSGYGQTLVTAYAKLDGMPVGIVANQHIQTKTGKGEVEIGGVIYSDAADKAARFIMDCNQTKLPLLFFQDVMGFMVGREAEQSGIIRNGAKMVNAVSNSIVPKITVVVGSSFGAGNYALCGKAYDPNFILAWPNAKYAVMGADQAADTLFTIQEKAAERKGKAWDKEEAKQMRREIKKRYEEQTDIRYGAARGWIDSRSSLPHDNT